MPEASIQKVVWAAFQIKNEEFPKIETRFREEYSKAVISRLLKTLGTMADLAEQNKSYLLLGNVVTCLMRIILSLLEEKLITFEEMYQEEIIDTLNDLEKAYSSARSSLFKDETHSIIPVEIANAITSIAIYALESEQTEITNHCLEVLNRVSVKFVEVDKYGYDVARCAGRIGVIGAYALSKNNKEVVDLAADFLVCFNKTYMDKSPSPHARLHISEMRRLHKKFSEDRLASFEEEVYGKLYKTVSNKTLEDFAKLYEKKRKSIK